MKKTLNIIKRAVEKGLDINPETSIIDACDAAENYLRDIVEYDRMEQVELCGSGSSQQYYAFEDKQTWGEVFDFANYTKKDRVYFHVPTGKFVNWFDIPEEEEKRGEYGFIFATEFDGEGQLVALYDCFY